MSWICGRCGTRMLARSTGHQLMRDACGHSDAPCSSGDRRPEVTQYFYESESPSGGTVDCTLPEKCSYAGGCWSPLCPRAHTGEKQAARKGGNGSVLHKLRECCHNGTISVPEDSGHEGVGRTDGKGREPRSGCTGQRRGRWVRSETFRPSWMHFP